MFILTKKLFSVTLQADEPAEGQMENTAEESEEPMAAVLVPPHRVSIMWTAWVFFKTFFSSLIPEVPQGLANWVPGTAAVTLTRSPNSARGSYQLLCGSESFRKWRSEQQPDVDATKETINWHLLAAGFRFLIHLHVLCSIKRSVTDRQWNLKAREWIFLLRWFVIFSFLFQF